MSDHKPCHSARDHYDAQYCTYEPQHDRAEPGTWTKRASIQNEFIKSISRVAKIQGQQDASHTYNELETASHAFPTVRRARMYHRNQHRSNQPSLEFPT